MIVCGAAPASGAATRSAAALTASSTSPPGSASRTAATARPISWARSRCRHGIGHHELVRVAGRADPHRQPRVPGLVRDARTSRATARAANRCRNPESGSPGRAFLSPIRVANRDAFSSARRDSPLMSRVSLIAARGKYRFGPSRTRSSTRDVTDVER